MKTLHLSDLTRKNVYIRLNDSYREKFFKYFINLAGGKFKLAKLLNINYRVFSYYMYDDRSMPVVFIYKILNLSDKNERKYFIKQIEANLKEIKYGKTGKPIKNPKLPIRLSPDLCRIAGHIIGDGGIINKNGNYTTHYSNKNSYLLEQFKEDVNTVFGEIEPKEIFNKKNGGIQLLFPSIVGYMLMIFFGIQTGKYKHVPKLIMESNKQSKATFLKSIFDDEGCVNITAQKIELQMCGRAIIESIQKILNGFNIKSGEIYKTDKKGNWRAKFKIGISNELGMKIFQKEINFDDEKKKEKLELLIRRYKKSSLSKEEFKETIIKTLNRNGNMSLLELTKSLPYAELKYRLGVLEKEGTINSKITRGNFKGTMKVYFTHNNKGGVTVS